MKIIKAALIAILTAIAIQPIAQAQNKPEFCQIYSGNLSNYVSPYNMIDHSSRTPYRAFTSNTTAYQVTNSLAALPLYYTGSVQASVNFMSDPIFGVFELKGKYGNVNIDNRNIVTQVLEYWYINSNISIVGVCVNGVFVPTKPERIYSIYSKDLILPQATINALQEAYFGLQEERVNSLIK